jgi:hypothetical protein
MSSFELSTPAAAPSEEGQREKIIKEHKVAVGKANFEAAKAKVGGLSALEKTDQGRKWLHALVPTSDEEARELNDELNACVKTPGFFEDDDRFEKFEELRNKAMAFYKGRNSMYTDVLKHPEHGIDATREISALAGILDATFKQGYNNIFETWIQVGDSVALSEFAKWAEVEGAKLKAKPQTMMQSSNDLSLCYANACDQKLIDKYVIFFEKVAKETGGVFALAPIKSPMRALEKTAFKHEEKTRFQCENVYDVVRGSISYPTMEGIKLGAEKICTSEEFVALRMSDRFSEGTSTSSGWRDGMINGNFKGRNPHKVEVQLHHEKLVSIREDLGGHYMYAIYRSLVEALEVVYGDEKGKVQKMVDEHGRKFRTDSHNDQLEADNQKLAGENEELRANINELNEKAQVSVPVFPPHSTTAVIIRFSFCIFPELRGEIKRPRGAPSPPP